MRVLRFLSDLRIMGRATQGVKLINLKGDDSIAAVAKVMKDDEDVEDIVALLHSFTGPLPDEIATSKVAK